MKYTRLITTITVEEEAEQFFPDSPAHPDLGICHFDDNLGWYVKDFTGRVYITSGDWIILQPDLVHAHVYKPDAFAINYTAVDN